MWAQASLLPYDEISTESRELRERLRALFLCFLLLRGRVRVGEGGRAMR